MKFLTVNSVLTSTNTPLVESFELYVAPRMVGQVAIILNFTTTSGTTEQWHHKATVDADQEPELIALVDQTLEAIEADKLLDKPKFTLQLEDSWQLEYFAAQPKQKQNVAISEITM